MKESTKIGCVLTVGGVLFLLLLTLGDPAIFLWIFFKPVMVFIGLMWFIIILLNKYALEENSEKDERID